MCGFVCGFWLALGLSVRLYKLCLAWDLSVCPPVQVMFGTGFVCLSVCGGAGGGGCCGRHKNWKIHDYL